MEDTRIWWPLFHHLRADIQPGWHGGWPGSDFSTLLLAGQLVGAYPADPVLARVSNHWGPQALYKITKVNIYHSMGLVAHITPNFAAIEASFGMEPAPIQTFAGTPPDGLKTGGDGSAAGINAAAQAVLASGGCMFFPAFMAEMRHPMDFWKGMILGQAVLAAVYIVFGMEVYHFYGQFAYLPIVQAIGNYCWQTALNALSIVAGLIATCLYTNVGLKIAYAEVLQPMGLPPLTTKTGKVWWAILMPVI